MQKSLRKFQFFCILAILIRPYYRAVRRIIVPDSNEKGGKMKKAAILLIVLTAFTAAWASAATQLVPQQYRTIQAAIDASTDGDTVIVAAGTYTGDGNRDIEFRGKAITLRSTDPNDPAIVAATIIDCNGTKADPHRGFLFRAHEGPNSIIAGLSVINGYTRIGAALYCISGSPTIINCNLMYHNRSTESCKGDVGCAIYTEYCKSDIRGCNIIGGRCGIRSKKSRLAIQGCNISDNEQGGICIQGHRRFVRQQGRHD